VITDRYAAQRRTWSSLVAAVIEANRALQRPCFFDRVVGKWFPAIYSAEQRPDVPLLPASWGVNGGMPLSVMRSALENWKTDVNPDRATSTSPGRGADGHAVRR
jgi:hypothetical protein